MEKKKMLIDIPTNRMIEIPKLLNRHKCQFGVELGVFKGEFSKHLLENWQGTLYLIDPWRSLGEEYIDSSNHKNHNNIYQEAINNIRGFETRAFMLRGLGEDLVCLFSDESLDFVYIDGNHAYEFVKKDLRMWWPKLKKGGLLMGHDYLMLDWYDLNSHMHENGIDKHMWMKGSDDKEHKYAGVFGVNPAVDEFCQENNLFGTVTANEFTGSFIIHKPLISNKPAN